MTQPSLTIGITTYNRRDVLETVARSLAQVDGLAQARLWIVDDCSQEFDAAFLRALFPQAEVFRASENSGGADFAMHRLFDRFVQHGEGYLLNLDADLLASRHLVTKCRQIIELDQRADRPGLYSLFNTASHPALAADGEFLLKRSVGAAGTLWPRALLAEVLQNVPASNKYDWDWSAYLGRRGVPIRVTRRSYVQHLGRVGQNSRSFAGMDHGEHFDDYRNDNLASFLDHTREGLLKMIADQQARIDNQAKAIEQISRVVQGQAQLIHALIGSVPEQTIAH